MYQIHFQIDLSGVRLLRDHWLRKRGEQPIFP